MSVLQIATLGLYANQRIDYVLNRCAADKLVLIGTEENKEEIEAFKSRFNNQNYPFDYRILEPWNYEKILATVLEIVLEHPKHMVEFNISCGPPTMRIACHMAAVLLEAPVHFVSEEGEKIIGDLVTVKPIPISKLTEPKRNILHELAKKENGINSQTDLGSKVELRASSISKHLKELRAANFVVTEKIGLRNQTTITDLGRMILRLKETRKERIWT